MTDFTVSRLGDVNSGGSDPLQLFLKVFPGEVLTSFNTMNVMMDKHQVRTIASGKSAQFPAIGRAAASYHTPGVQILGSELLHNEVVINIDNILQSNAFVADFDEAMNHYDVRGEYARQLGEALAKEADENILIAGLLGARASATITGGETGGSVTNAAAKTDGTVLAGLIFDGAQKLDENFIPEGDRMCAVKPAQYYLLNQTTQVLNKDWGGAGSYADGKIINIAGIDIVKTNNLPTTNIASSPTGTNNTYHGDFSATAGLIWHRSGIGTVKLMDLSVGKEYMLSRLGTLMVAYYAMGHKYLRPEACIEIDTA